jgi:SAM-dependent methyltransferase
MTTRWVVDPEANDTLWREISEMPLRLVDGPRRWVADLGGGNGNFVAPLAANASRLVSVDVDLPALRGARERDVRAVAGTALALPLRQGSLDAMAGRAVLHHVPDELEATIAEVSRVVKPGGLVLFQEPTSGNRLANVARHRFPTERHDPHERPLPSEAYVEAIRRHFQILDVRPYFLLSYLLPHLVARLPPNRRPFGRAVTRVLFRLDERLLASLPGLRSRAAYISILARRPTEETARESG